ncbi:hypothetical protein BN871_EW_00170 [Paenibacillus sp. P22]|nr:hypothetical protein BN871_EW_00170 [Paenibacillus sp. P22]
MISTPYPRLRISSRPCFPVHSDRSSRSAPTVGTVTFISEASENSFTGSLDASRRQSRYTCRSSEEYSASSGMSTWARRASRRSGSPSTLRPEPALRRSMIPLRCRKLSTASNSLCTVRALTRIVRAISATVISYGGRSSESRIWRIRYVSSMSLLPPVRPQKGGWMPAICPHPLASSLLFVRQSFDELVVFRTFQEIVDGNMLRLRRYAASAVGKRLVRNDDVRIRRDVADRGIRDFDRRACSLHLLAEDGCAHGAGSHACVAGKDDFMHFILALQTGRHSCSRFASAFGCRSCGRGRSAGSLHVFHALGCSFQIVFVFICLLARLEQQRGNKEGYDRSRNHAAQNRENLSARRHRQVSDDAARGRRSDEASAEQGERERTGYAACDGSQNQARVHQDVREVDLMNPAEEMDDRCAGSGLAGSSAADEHVGQQDAETRARVGLQHEQDRLAGFLGLLDRDRVQDAVIDRIVQEQDLRRLDQDVDQRNKMVGDQPIHACGEDVRQAFNDASDDRVSDQDESAADDAEREVVDEHLEAGTNLAFDGLVKLLQHPCRAGTYDHRPEEHRNVGADDDAHGDECADDAAALLVDHRTAGITDQQRKQIGDHRADELGEIFVREPACRYEQGRDQSPSDERSDIRHDHAAKEASEFLNSYPGTAG